MLVGTDRNGREVWRIRGRSYSASYIFIFAIKAFSKQSFIWLLILDNHELERWVIKGKMLQGRKQDGCYSFLLNGEP